MMTARGGVVQKPTYLYHQCYHWNPLEFYHIFQILHWDLFALSCLWIRLSLPHIVLFCPISHSLQTSLAFNLSLLNILAFLSLVELQTKKYPWVQPRFGFISHQAFILPHTYSSEYFVGFLWWDIPSTLVHSVIFPLVQNHVKQQLA